MAVESALGFALMLSPLVLDYGTAGFITVAVLGALVVAISFTAAPSDERGGLALSTHAAFDLLAGVALSIGGVALAAAGDRTAFMALAAAGLAVLVLHAVTSYSAPRRANRLLS